MEVGHITADFKFNVIDLLKQHFRAHNIVVVSFKRDLITIQTMTLPGLVPDIAHKGLYTTTISLESLKEYDFDCSCEEVNVMVMKQLTSSKYVKNCNVINVVSNGEVVEVSFDIVGKRGPPAKPKEDIIEPGSLLFGSLIVNPYLHFLINSRINYSVQVVDSEYERSISISNPKVFKSLFDIKYVVFIGKKGSILLCGCHINGGFDCCLNGMQDHGDNDDEFVCHIQLAGKTFRHLFKFMGSSIANFDILYSSSIPMSIPHDIREKIIKTMCNNRTFDIGYFLHDIHRTNVVIPEFNVKNKYYSTHVIFREYEPTTLKELRPYPYSLPYSERHDYLDKSSVVIPNNLPRYYFYGIPSNSDKNEIIDFHIKEPMKQYESYYNLVSEELSKIKGNSNAKPVGKPVSITSINHVSKLSCFPDAKLLSGSHR